MRKSIVRSILLIALWLSLFLPSVKISKADLDQVQALPAGFTDSSVMTLPGAPVITDVELTPDGGRLLIATQVGRLFVFNTATNALVGSAALDLLAADTVCTDFERGLESVAVDPAFAVNKFIYVYHSWNGTNGGGGYNCANNTNARNRVVRYTLNDNNTTSNPQVIITNLPSPCGNHNGGDLQFGADGLLYISVGDGGCRMDDKTQTGGNNDNARFRSILNGKILRLNKDGSIPSSNPYANDPNGIVCGSIITQTKNTTQRCKETYAWGLRNPFKFAFRHGTNEFRINDVGQANWEEVNIGGFDFDYGWYCREGKHDNSTSDSCNPRPANMQDPILEYDHNQGCSITGGAFATSSTWPLPYRNAYFFADYCGNAIYYVQESGGQYTRITFSDLGRTPIGLLFDRATNALFYSTYGGEVRKITYSPFNRPIARASASPTSGSAPLAVVFNGSASSDPDNDPITARWDFGDGTAATTLVSNHTYTRPGTFIATLVVTDSGNLASTPWTAQINVGNDPPQPTIGAPASNARFSVGQALVLSGSATDPQDGALNASRLSWNVLLHHVPQSQPQNRHTHPFFSGTGNNLTLPTMPSPEDLDAAPLSYIEIQLTATDLQGLARTVTQTLLPNRVPMRLATQPNGLQVTANSVMFVGPQTFTAWANQSLLLNAPSPQTLGTNSFSFAAWSDGGAASHSVLAPAAGATLTATYAATSASASTLLLYGDARAAGWDDWSDGVTRAWDSTSPVKVGSSALRVQVNAPYGVVTLRGQTAVNASDYQSLDFWVYGGPNGNVLAAFVQAGDATQPSLYASFTAIANQWTLVSIRLSAFGNISQIKRVNIQDMSGQSGGVFSIDQLTLVAKAPPTNAQDHIIYGDALGATWQSWSYDILANFANTSIVKTGSNAIQVQVTQPWGTLALRNATVLTASTYASAAFDVYGDAPQQTLAAFVQEGDATQPSQFVYFSTTPGAWKRVTVPLGLFGAVSKIKRVNIQDTSGTANRTFYVDDLRLVANAAAAAFTSPTAVELEDGLMVLSVNTQALSTGTALTWQLQGADVTEVQVYRSPNDNWAQAQLVSTQAALGHWLDTQPGSEATYWLKATLADGTQIGAGPIHPQPTTQPAGVQVFLPVVVR